MADPKKPNKLTGKLKWLDSQGIGYILPDSHYFPEAYVTPSSLSSKFVIKEGDSVEFDIKLCGSEPLHAIQAIDVVPTKVYCNYCERFGHEFLDCQQHRNSIFFKCSRCGLVGHSSKNCDQKYKGWFFDKNNKRKTVKRVSFGSCNGGSWLSLFGGAYNGGGVGPDSTAEAAIVCVKKREDVKKVEKVEDCFILEFDPTLDDDGDQSVKSIVCVKKREDVKKVEKVEDCFILEFDPSELDKFSELSLCEKSNVVGGDDDDDVTILAEKGKVACRDYPHPRYLCATLPFKKTSHVLHCTMCYCYICDIPAPCKKWNEGFKIYGLNHCDATDELSWRVRRDLEKSQTQDR